jgi:hypothetical protein
LEAVPKVDADDKTQRSEQMITIGRANKILDSWAWER